MLALFLCGEFLLHIPCCLNFDVRSFSYTSCHFFEYIFIRGISLTHPVLALFLMLGVSLTHPMLSWFLCNMCPLHIPCWHCFLYILGVSRTHPVRFFFFFIGGFFVCRVYLTHPVLNSFYLGSFSYTSHAGFLNFYFRVSLTHPMLASLLSGEFLLHIPCWVHFYMGSFSYTSHAGVIFIWGVCLTHPVLDSFLCGEFLLHLPFWL